MKRKMSKVLMVVAILLMSLSSSFTNSKNIVSAQELDSVGFKMNEIFTNYENADQQFEDLAYNQIEKELYEIKKMIKSDDIKVFTDNEVNYDEAFGKIHNQSSETYIFIPFEVEDEEFELNSAVIQLDKNNEFVGIMEMDLKADKESKQGTIKTWENGKAVLNDVIELPEESFEVNVVQESPGFQTFGLKDRWGTFSDCLNSQGVSYALITLAGAICGGACGVTWGAGCAPCFYGLSFISGGVIGHCFQKALQ